MLPVQKLMLLAQKLMLLVQKLTLPAQELMLLQNRNCNQQYIKEKSS